jgi:hypothetical protein
MPWRQGLDENDLVGHTVLQAELTPPLVEIDGTGEMRFCQIRLSPEGEAKQHTIND